MGQAAAVAMTFLVLLVLGLGVAAPSLSWYFQRADAIAAMRTRIAHERAVIASLPELRRALAAGHRDDAGTVMLAGGSDAVAGAALQGRVQKLAAATAITLDSAELLAPQPIGRYRRVRLRVTMTTDYHSLIALLGAIAQAQPRMLVDDFTLHSTGLPDPGRDLPVRASFTISAFRAARRG